MSPICRNEFLDVHKDDEVVSSKESLVPEIIPTTPVSTVSNLNLETSSTETEKENGFSLLDRLNISDHLIFKNQDDEGPDIRGGHPDALVVHATKAHKNGPSYFLVDCTSFSLSRKSRLIVFFFFKQIFFIRRLF